MTLQLIGLLKSEGGQHIERVWVNSKGEYHLRKTVGFKEYSRQEILSKEKDLLKKEPVQADPAATKLITDLKNKRGYSSGTSGFGTSG